jgi:hypothetical protein
VTFTLGTLAIDDECAVWVGDVRGTDTGGLMGLPTTNKPFRLPEVMLCTVQGGLIIHEQRIYDFRDADPDRPHESEADLTAQAGNAGF